MNRDYEELTGGWWLWRDFAVRSAGFPVDGLERFGGEDEARQLAELAGDLRFREAVTWQNPAAVANALDKLGGGKRTSDQRRREQVVASYWQRYCAKNDTIGFFGPLAWGRIGEAGPALAARPGPAQERRRDVHLEAWGVQALAATLDPGLSVASGLRAEDDLRVLLEAHADAGLRARGLEALDRLEAARDALAAAGPDEVFEGLRALDACFVELTGMAPTRNHGRAYGARTLAYVDCLRDLDLDVGPELIAELEPVLRLIFEAGRWYCGRVQAVARDIVGAIAAEQGGAGPLGPVIGRALATLMALPESLDAEVAELQRRVAALVTDPDPGTLGERAAAAFADHQPAWILSGFESVDVQLAAHDTAAIDAGDYLAVIGDVHPGDNPLGQSLFGERFPDRERYFRLTREATGGRPFVLLMPPWAPGMGVDARGVGMLADDDIVVTMHPGAAAPPGPRSWPLGELVLDGDEATDREGEIRLPVLDVLGLPIFVTAVRTFALFAGADHEPRLTIGRVVLRRESWHPPANDVPAAPDAIAEWAAGHGIPRRVFAKSPLERKPLFVDLESPTLTRILIRQARQAAAADPAARMRLTEMLPLPEQCWLADPEDHRYASELRFVAVARPGATASTIT